MSRARDADKEQREAEARNARALLEAKKEKRRAAAQRMRERQAALDAKRVSAEELAKAAELMEKDARQDNAGADSGDDEDAGYVDHGEQDGEDDAIYGEEYYYGKSSGGARRRGQQKQGFNVIVMHDDDDADDGISTDRGLSASAKEFMETAMNRNGLRRAPLGTSSSYSGVSRRSIHSASFVSGKLTQKRSYRRKRPTKRQKREWAAKAAERRAHGGGENDSDFDEEMEAEELAGIRFES